MGAARVKKKARRHVEKSLSVDKSHDKSPSATPLAAASETAPLVVIDALGRPRFGVAADPSLRGRGPAVGAPNAGRPPNAWRAHARTILDEDGAAAAREILQGNPDQAGRVPDQALRMRLIEKLTEIGFNERMRTAKLDAEATAAANTGSKAMAGVQVILHGGPAGNERVDIGT